MKRVLTLLGAVLVAFLLITRAQASIALTTPGRVADSDSNLTVGWRFTTSMPIAVTHLGLWDWRLDGLVADHPVEVDALMRERAHRGVTRVCNCVAEAPAGGGSQP